MDDSVRQPLAVAVTDTQLPGDLCVPAQARGLVIFAHGSGSSRLSPRNRLVAEKLNGAGFATLLFDLLTEAEDRCYAHRFDMDLLTERLVEATEHVSRLASVSKLPVGFFGASTGAAAALAAAARLGKDIRSVVSRGGRPDLAMDWLPDVDSAVLLMVGSLDTEVLELNRRALAELRCRKVLKVIEGASHLFEEPGAMDRVAAYAAEWYRRTLVAVPARRTLVR